MEGINLETLLSDVDGKYYAEKEKCLRRSFVKTKDEAKGRIKEPETINQGDRDEETTSYSFKDLW